MYIRDVEPVGNAGINLLEENNAEEIIDKIIEMPLRKACKNFYKKGIQTVMSSANKNNIAQNGESPKTKKDVSGEDRWMFLDAPTFEDAGVGFAWIMLNFDSLSDENKEILLRLEERKDKNGNNTGEEAIWFVHPAMIGYKFYSEMKDEIINNVWSKENVDNGMSVKKAEFYKKYVDFESKSVILLYSDRYPVHTVILRRPVNEDTTVEEVEDYFLKISELLKSQRIQNIEIKRKEDEGISK